MVMLALTLKIDSPHSRRGNVPGYSLPELFVVLALLSIMAAQAAPAFQQIIGTSKQRIQSNALHDAIRLARHTAGTEGATITLCPRGNNDTCGNDWSLGWAVLRSDLASGKGIATTINETRLADSQLKVTSNRQLFMFAPSGRSTNGTVLFCAAGSSQPWAVIVSYTGKSRVSQPDAGSAAACL